MPVLLRYVGQLVNKSVAMDAQSYETDTGPLLADLLSWDCEAAGIRGSQQFMNTLEDMARYNAVAPVFEVTNTPRLSQTTDTRSTSAILEVSHRTERKLEINRMSQKRVRDRRKVLRLLLQSLIRRFLSAVTCTAEPGVELG